MGGGWSQLVQDRGIPYQKGSGANIEIHCPLCGPEDRSMHMGLHLESSRWSCWRNDQHRGINPVRLIEALLTVTREQAAVLSRSYFGRGIVPVKSSPDTPVRSLEGPRAEFHRFTGGQLHERQFGAYLAHRGYDLNFITQRYDLRWAITGEYRYRVIIPIIADGRWRTYTARTIGDTTPRYLTCKESEAGCRPTDFLFDQDNLLGGELLEIVEGAFDAMKVKQCLIPGVDSTALSGKVLSNEQLSLIARKALQYRLVRITLDKAEFATSIGLVNRLSYYAPNVVAGVPPEKDYGSMDVVALKEHIQKGLT